MAEHEVARAIRIRRSWRVFMEDPLDDDTVAALRWIAGAAPSIGGGRAGRLELVTERERVAGLTAAVLGGVIPKINLWLRSSLPAAWATLVGDAARGERHGPHHLYNVDAAIVGELVALEATAHGVGSCWMSAIHQPGIGLYLGLSDDDRVPAAIALGWPGERRKGAVLASARDRLTRRIRGDRRKPMAEIVSLDRWGGDPPGDTEPLAAMPNDGRTLAAVVDDLAPSAVFAGRPLEDAALGWVLQAMRRAPSANNSQTWRFVVVRGAESTVRVLEAAGHPLAMADAPGTLIAAFAAPVIVKKLQREQPFALIDHAIALTHGLVVAGALGLAQSALWRFDGPAVREQLGVPDSHVPTFLLALDREGRRSEAPHPGHVQLY